MCLCLTTLLKIWAFLGLIYGLLADWWLWTGHKSELIHYVQPKNRILLATIGIRHVFLPFHTVPQGICLELVERTAFQIPKLPQNMDSFPQDLKTSPIKMEMESKRLIGSVKHLT